jgi:phospholipid/cholesterol/gamma-HCH transport system substrate-binding protein
MEKRGIELVVGIFVIVGVAIASFLVIKFSEGQRVSGDTYTLTVAFPSADGILRGARVRMSGVPIGRVLLEPTISPSGDKALVPISVTRGVSIRDGSTFLIRESGLLGDRYIEVVPSGDTTAPAIPENSVVDGYRKAGLAELTGDVRPLIMKGSGTVDQISSILTKVDKNYLTPETEKEFKSALQRLNSVLGRMDNLLAQAERGQGALSTLLKDKSIANNLKGLMYNLRTRGLLFYRDVAEEEAHIPNSKPAH